MTTRETAHTPTPWFQSHRKITGNEDGMHSTEIYCKDGKTIASLSWYVVDKGDGVTSTSRGANAAHIVKCVNSHDSLVKHLKECIRQIRIADCMDDNIARNHGYDQAINEAEKALLQAGLK